MPEGISNHSHRRRNFARKAIRQVDKNAPRSQTLVMRLPVVCLIATALLSLPSRAQVPVFKVTPIQGSIRCNTRSSSPIDGNFGKWSATLTFTSRDAETGALDVEIQAASVQTGNKTKDDALKSKDFLNSGKDPVISFKTTSSVQTSKTTFDLAGTLTFRGVSKPATLSIVIADQGFGVGYVQGTMSFNRKDYGMTGNNSLKIADSIEIDLNFKADQISGPKLAYKQFRY
ncbi:MAG: YceI family protein [Silvibacterium sp.]|nr:YceI family protein [Silvibacterium sp.]